MSSLNFPHTLSNNTVADANHVMANFNAIRDFTNTEVVRNDGSVKALLSSLANEVINKLVPVGTIAMFGGSVAPTGWLPCDGISTTGYPLLQAVVGATTPDLRGRVPVGSGSGAGLTERTLGTTGGSETHTLTVGQIPSHAHFYNQTTVTQRVVFNPDLDLIDDVVNAFGSATTGSEGGGQPHNNMQPFRVVTYIIKHD
jgi:microcystin-dependent protein